MGSPPRSFRDTPQGEVGPPSSGRGSARIDTSRRTDREAGCHPCPGGRSTGPGATARRSPGGPPFPMAGPAVPPWNAYSMSPSWCIAQTVMNRNLGIGPRGVHRDSVPGRNSSPVSQGPGAPPALREGRPQPRPAMVRFGDVVYHAASECLLGPVGMCGFDRARIPGNASRGRHWASLKRWQKEVPGNRQSTLALAA